MFLLLYKSKGYFTIFYLNFTAQQVTKFCEVKVKLTRK